MRIAAFVFVALVGCGARTGLEERAVDAGASDAEPPSAEPRVVFNLFDGGDDRRLYVMRADGTGARPLDLPDRRALYATFTRDGLQMLYVALGPGPRDDASIVVFDLRTRARRTLVRGAKLSALAVSPDRRTVAYTASLDLRAVGWDGSGDRLLVRGPYALGCCQWGYGHPAFAADPLTVFFSTASRIERIGVDGARRQLLLTEDFRRIIFPNVTVSPDGARLAAGVACGSTRALRSYAVAALPAACEAGDLVTMIEPSTVGNQSNNPAWGESGQIVYQQRNDLFVVDARGGVARNLTATLTGGEGSDTSAAYPAWAPRGVVLP
jgi:hypothetical protein